MVDKFSRQRLEGIHRPAKQAMGGAIVGSVSNVSTDPYTVPSRWAQACKTLMTATAAKHRASRKPRIVLSSDRSMSDDTSEGAKGEGVRERT